MSNERQKEEIIAQTDLADLCRELGLEPDAKGRVARCPAHDDQGRPNLAIYPKNVYCFACGFHADAFALVGKVKGLDFKGSFDFLAARLGLPLLADQRSDKTRFKARGLGNGAKGGTRNIYPKAAPLPDSPSPTLTVKSDGLGNNNRGEAAETYPKAAPEVEGGKPPLPIDQWRDFATFAEAWAYWQATSGSGYMRALGLDKDRHCYFIRGCDKSGRVIGSIAPKDHADLTDRPSRSKRVQAFAALLELATPASKIYAGEWLYREKGIEYDTQDRFGLVWIDDPRAAEQELRRQFDEETLLRFGILGEAKDKRTKEKRIYFAFYRHRLLFPFFWRGEPVDIQGRDINAKDKQGRFRNTGGKNLIPYNADALTQARETGEPIFVCEGATDTLTLAQSGRLAVGIVGTGGFKREWLPGFDGLSVYLAFDADDAGRKSASDVTRLFVDAGLPAPKVVRLPDGVKDINEFFRRETAK